MPASGCSTWPRAAGTPRSRRAARGAILTAADLTTELFVAGRAAAAARGVELDWVEADAEALPSPDDSFEAVISVVGAMFAPHHRQTADEMLRVCKTGGTLAMINWTPQGLIGTLFETMAPYAPPAAPGAAPPPLWATSNRSVTCSATG